MKSVFNDERITIALFLDDLRGGYAYELWETAIEYCRDRNVHLILFPCEAATNRNADKWYQHFLMFEFVEKIRVDGIIMVTNTLLSFSETNDIIGLIKRYLHTPTVSINIPLEGAITTIRCDNDYGIQEAMKHLVEYHGDTKIGFIKGQANHQDSIERFNSYKAYLQSHDLPYHENYVFEGDFFIESGKDAAKEYIKRGVKLDGLIACNDDMAIGFMQELAKEGIEVPKDIHVIGFDDIQGVRFTGSPLSTVRQPLDMIARYSIESLLDHIEGKVVKDFIDVLPVFIHRTSCGCFFDSNHTLVKGGDNQVLDRDIEAKIHDIVHKTGYLNFEGEDRFIYIIKNLLSKPLNDQEINGLLKNVDDIFASIHLTKIGIKAWKTIVQELALYVGVSISDHDKWVETFFIGLMDQLNDLEKLFKGMEQVSKNQNLESLMVESLHEFIASDSVEELMDTIHTELPKVDIDTYFLCLYDNNRVLDEKGNAYLPKESRMYLGYDKIQRYKPDKVSFPTQQIIPHSVSFENRPYTMVIEPLFFGHEAYGYAFYELGLSIGSIYETVRKHICSTLRYLSILDERNRKNRELEMTLERLKTTQEQLIQAEKLSALGGLVAGVAHEINTPLGVAVSAGSHLEDISAKLLKDIDNNQLTRNSLKDFLETMEESTRLIQANLNRAADLVGSFKNIAVDQTSELARSFNVKSYINEILVSLHPKLKHRLIKVRVLGEDQLNVAGYPGAFGQVMSNLMMNSLVHAHKTS